MRASATPLTTTLGALSPPIASSAMVNDWITRRFPPSRSVGLGRLGPHHLAAAVLAAGRADMVRPHQFTAVLAFDVSCLRERVMGSAHVATRLGFLSLRNSHDRTLSSYERKSATGAAKPA